MAATIQQVKEFILRTFLPGEDPTLLTETTPLIQGGILDSLATLELVAFLEKQFGIELEAHEMDQGHLGTLAAIGRLVESKRSGRKS
jgi:acyl carrier protein